MIEGKDELAHAPTLTSDDAPEVDDGPAPGSRIGRFTVVGPLGAGGMGTVVEARDPELDRSVALKLVRTGGSSQAALSERLLREARAMARLRHGNVLTVYEAGTHGDWVYLAMELVGGGTLREAMATRGWRELVGLFAGAGEGLAAAHEAGLVHRDFKPENVLLEGDRVLVADFGLVAGRPEVMAAGELADRPLPALTQVGELVGTPRYMAPEQYAGGTVDARSDQFSFCVALYEALYGRLPFEGDTLVAWVDGLARGPAAPPSDSEVPSWIRDAVLRGLSHDPEARFGSMRELIAELTADPAVDRVGSRTRTIGVGVFAALVVVWAAASTLVDYQLSYGAMLAIDLSCLAVVIGFAAVHRRDLAQAAFNRRVMFTGASAVGAVLVLLAGGWVAGFPAAATALLHLFTMFCFATATVVLLDRRLWPVAVGYAAGFGVSAADYSLFFPASVVAHGIMAVGLVVVLGGQKPIR